MAEATSQVPKVLLTKLENMPSSKNWLFIGILVLLIISLFTTAILVYQNYQLRQQIKQVQQESALAPTPSFTTNWQTYTNEKYRFSFFYPHNWHLVEAKDGTYAAVTNYDPDGHKSPEFLPGNAKVEVYSNNREFISLPESGESQELTLAGQPAIQFVEDQTALSLRGISDLAVIKRIYMDKGSVRYGVVIYFAEPSSELQDQVTILLDTFKFLD